jgi:tripartite-type tricarboxylate transporter receptor subunit TctC
VNARLTRRGFLAATAGVTVIPSASRSAAAYPAQDLTWLLYQNPGGTVDVSTRILQPFIERAGFKVRLVYAIGAAGRIARNRLFAARPDGYTIMTEVAPGAVIDELVYDVKYKAESFEPIFGWSNTGFQYCAKGDSPIRTFADFVAETKKRRVTVGSFGRGGAHHLHILTMRRELGLNFDIVHFEGSSPAYAAVMGGHIDVSGGGAASGQRVGAGRLRFLAVTGLNREFALPAVPTLSEQGFKVTPVNQIFFAMTTPGIPADRAAVLRKAFSDTIAQPAFAEQMIKGVGDKPIPLTPAEIRTEHSRHRELIVAFKDELKR